MVVQIAPTILINLEALTFSQPVYDCWSTPHTEESNEAMTEKPPHYEPKALLPNP